MTLSTKILLGLGLGILSGLFAGERMAVLDTVGQGFVSLLQMTVLPYVVVSLIGGLGRLTPAGAVSLARHAGSYLLIFWALTIAVVLLMPLAFPAWETASFFSTTLIETRGSFDFLKLYVPANPFHVLAEGIVPAVVVFSVAFGLALMRIESKDTLLESLAAAEAALLDVTNVVVQLSPYGVFAIAAAAAGTMEAHEFEGLQVYAAVYAAMALVLGLWILPGLLAALTPLGHRQVLGSARDALVTAFATGSVFVVLPILAKRSKALLEEQEGAGEEASRIVDVVVPISFTLASAGKLLTLSFILFAGWLSGYAVPPSQYPGFVFTGIFSFFASTFVAVPFLLDLYRIPADVFQLFVIADNVVGNRFGAMLAGVHTLSLALLAACGARGLVAMSRRRLLRWALVGLLLTVGSIAVIRAGFEAMERPYQGYRLFVERPLLFPAAPATERKQPPAPEEAGGGTALDRLRARGVMRVGYVKDRLPFVFRNEAGEFRGFDVEMVYALARDFGVKVEFSPIDAEEIASRLDTGSLDFVIPGLAITPERLEVMTFSLPYQTEHLAFVVPDHMRGVFSSRSSIRAVDGLRIGVPTSSYYTGKVKQLLPTAEIVPLDSPRAFFRGSISDLDAVVWSAEAGAAWTLVYPQFAVAVPEDAVLDVPFAYAVSRRHPELADFLNGWIRLKRADGTIDALFDYWIRGKEPPERRRRWSVMQDVLGWGTGDRGDGDPHDAVEKPGKRAGS